MVHKFKAFSNIKIHVTITLRMDKHLFELHSGVLAGIANLYDCQLFTQKYAKLRK